MANYKKKTATVNIPFSYKGKFYKKDDKFVGKQKEVDGLTNYLKDK